jgi:hypothetical protein
MAENEPKAWVKAWGGPRAIGAYVTRMLDPVARARGFATITLLSEWPAVVGAELARFTVPDKVLWPRRFNDRDAPGTQSAWRVEGATLVLKVDGPRAIEVQHCAHQILERVNTHFGYRAIAQLRFMQAPVNRAVKGGSAPPLPVVEMALPSSVTIANQGLRHALMRLGASLRGKESGP